MILLSAVATWGEWAQKVPDLLLRKIFAVVLAATAVKVFLQ